MASTIQVRVDDDLKARSDALFKDLGTDTTTADYKVVVTRDAEEDLEVLLNILLLRKRVYRRQKMY